MASTPVPLVEQLELRPPSSPKRAVRRPVPVSMLPTLARILSVSIGELIGK